jgi:hypothetical protein
MLDRIVLRKAGTLGMAYEATDDVGWSEMPACSQAERFAIEERPTDQYFLAL